MFSIVKEIIYKFLIYNKILYFFKAMHWQKAI